MRLTVLVLAAMLACVAPGLVSGADSVATAPVLAWHADRSPFRLTILEDGEPLLRQHTGPAGAGTRLSYRVSEGGVVHRLTRLLRTTRNKTATVYRVATTEPDRTATVAVARTGRGVRVGLDLGRGSTSVRTVYESFDSAPSEHFLGTGERRDFVDLRGRIVPIKVWHECDSAKPSPFFLSSRGYGIRFETAAVGRMAFGKTAEGSRCQLGTAPCEIRSGSSVVQACFKTASLSYEVYPGTPEDVVRAYADSTGRPPLPAPDQFALTKWRDRLGSEAELAEDVDRFTDAGIPVGWVIVDNPWEVGGCAGSMAFDPALFPDPGRTIDGLHARGVRVMIWVSPVVRSGCGPDLYPLDRVVGSAEYRTIDLTDPAVVAGFEQRLRDLLTTSAVDGLKVDRGDEVDFELRTVAGGRGDAVHNRYPVLLAQAVRRALVAAGRPTVPTLYRAGFTGSQRIVTGVWSGDLPGSWNGLENAIRSAQTAGLVGYSTWGSDVGGYTSPHLTADVFVRWSQLGAISPVMEIGGDGPNSTPWQLGGQAMDGLRKAAILHYELFPYHYQLAREASRGGLSILRPLALHYPDDERSWAAEYELLVGPDLLAAPVTGPGTSPRVYLPRGDWVDLGTGAVVEGPVALTRRTPLDELPLYLRVGAAIPFNLREPDVWRAPWQVDDLFRAGRGAWLVAPGAAGAAGDSTEYGSVRATRAGGGVRIVLGRALPETQVVVLGNRTPTRVTIDGRTVARSASATTLRAARQGWLAERGRFPGIVLKLAPRDGRSTVELAYREAGEGA